jgi:hypothetical protein
MLLKTPCQAQIPFLSSSSPLPRLPASPLASLLCLHEGILFSSAALCPFLLPFSPISTPLVNKKESNMPFYFYYFYFYKKVGKFAMKIIENKTANFPTLL